MDVKSNGSDHTANYQPFAVAKDHELVRRFLVILRSGEQFSIPYSLLPLFVLNNAQELIIKAQDLIISVCGRNMKRLFEAFTKETCIYIHQSPVTTDDGQRSVFIEDIQIEGELLMY